jgi:asparagine synthase (glutamine-hydrolysing)
MCGITGFIDFRKESSEKILREMTDSMHLRGPDDSGYLFMNKDMAFIGLGHRRLSILDLSNSGHQPMSFSNLDIVFNGEVYNFREIRRELEVSGYSFASTSDTEVVLKAWHKWGAKAIDRFRGMFAFAVYDKKRETLTLVRDRCGIKPLYYYYDSKVFIFGSELKAFHKHPGFSKELDLGALGSYFKYGYVPQPGAIFKNTHKLKSGCIVNFSVKKREFQEESYWKASDFFKDTPSSVDEEEAERELERILKESFEYRMVSDVPVGVFLSGGYDSSAVVALLQSERSTKIKTFTIGFEEKEFDESLHAGRVAEYLGTDHTAYCCTQKDALEIIPLLPEIYDEPFGDSSAVPTTLVSRLARRSVTVSLSADGGDELFAGYGRYPEALDLWKRLNRIPRGIQKLARNTMRNIPPSAYPFRNAVENFDIRYERLKAVLGATSAAEVLKSKVETFTDFSIGKLLLDKYRYADSYFNEYRVLDNATDDLSHLLLTDYLTYMQDDILAKVDRATMSVSLEGRDPLLDHKIFEYAAGLPSGLKYRNGTGKYLLKKIVHKYIPPKIMERPKMGFGVPVTRWFKDELKNYFLEYLDFNRLKREGILNPAEVVGLRDHYLSGGNVNVQALWFILMFEMWYEKWMT